MSVSAKVENTKHVKVFVGAISETLAQDPKDLETRFSRFGKVIKPLDIHHKELLSTYFGYITLDISDYNFKKLRKNFNGVKYKGSNLVIDKAKPDYLSRWVKDSKREDKKSALRIRQDKIAKARDLRILNRDDPTYNHNVIKGRIRKTKRKGDFRRLQLRVNINGQSKVIKCLKTKLWGFDKNKKLRDLVYRFIDGEWRDGNNHVVDKLSTKIVSFESDGTVKITDRAEHPAVAESKAESKEEEDSLQIDLEKERNNKLLASLFNKYNFDKPIELEPEVDEDGGADYEYEAVFNSGSDDEQMDEIDDVYYNNANINKDCIKPSSTEIVEEYKKNETSLSGVVTFDEDGNDTVIPLGKNSGGHAVDFDDDSEDDISFLQKPSVSAAESGNENIMETVEENDSDKKSEKESDEESDNESEESEESEESDEESDKEEEAPEANVDSDIDTEFIPTFGSKNTEVAAEVEANPPSSDEDEFMPTFGKTPVSSADNKTEALRSLLNPVESEAQSFKLSVDDDEDIDQEKQLISENEQSEILKGQQSSANNVGGNVRLGGNPVNENLGLFFSHFESPFLIAQTQLNKFPKLTNIEEQFGYDKWFWENRGDLNREFRRLQRDSIRQQKKKSKNVTI